MSSNNEDHADYGYTEEETNYNPASSTSNTVAASSTWTQKRKRDIDTEAESATSKRDQKRIREEDPNLSYTVATIFEVNVMKPVLP